MTRRSPLSQRLKAVEQRVSPFEPAECAAVVCIVAGAAAELGVELVQVILELVEESNPVPSAAGRRGARRREGGEQYEGRAHLDARSAKLPNREYSTALPRARRCGSSKQQ